MRIIDAHAHLHDHPGYVERLLGAMDDCGIQKCCISGLGTLFGCQGNQEVKELLISHPERFIGAYFVRPGKTNPREISKAQEEGFKMLKVSIPTKPYDDPSFVPLWERAEELKMPILFHTGIVTLAQDAPTEGISSWFMHPMRLEPIANAFPRLNLIIAHLGIHWNADAAELMRMKPNVYADLTGEPDGWRVRADETGIKRWLWWKGAFKKLVFGTDVTPDKIAIILQQDEERLDQNEIDEKTREKIFSGNILHMLGEQ